MFSVPGICKDDLALSLSFWYSFTILDGMSEQGDIFLRSPRALYEAWGVQPLVCTILPHPRELGGIGWIT